MTTPQAPQGLRVTLIALTPEARGALGGAEVEITGFPFRVGRESRSPKGSGQEMSLERRASGSKPNNDLYLLERSELLNVSREHFQIERRDTGYVLVDRESTCGTIVEGATVGGQNKGGTVPLRDGDVIIVGTSASAYVFKFRVG